MSVVAQLDMNIGSNENVSTEAGPAGRVEALDCYALAETDLTKYAVLLVGSTVDQEHLARHRGVILDYLEGGGVVVFGGHLHRDWLPGASAFVPLPEPSLRAYRVEHVADHPVFAGITPDDLTFRRGVAGFFARGHHPPPEGAEILVRLAGGQPATYVDQVSTAGTILVQATCDLLSYSGSTDSPAAAIGSQLIDWAIGESRQTGPAQTAVVRPTHDQRPPMGEPVGAPTGTGLAALYGGSALHHRMLTAPKYARHFGGGVIYLPDLADTDLTGYAGVVIPERMHRGMLNRGADRILGLLDAGGTVVAFSGGEPVPEFLPNVRWEHRPTNYWWWLEPGADLGLRTPTPDHALFDHLGLRDCTWHYHGVLDPPDGAEVLVTLPSGEALLYVDRISTPGTLVVATLDPISHFGGYFMPATEQFLDGFLPWLSAALETNARP